MKKDLREKGRKKEKEEEEGRGKGARRERERESHGLFWLALDEGKLWQTGEMESEEVNGFDLSKP